MVGAVRSPYGKACRGGAECGGRTHGFPQSEGTFYTVESAVEGTVHTVEGAVEGTVEGTVD